MSHSYLKGRADLALAQIAAERRLGSPKRERSYSSITYDLSRIRFRIRDLPHNAPLSAYKVLYSTRHRCRHRRSRRMAAIAYPEIYAFGRALWLGAQAVAAAVPVIGLAITHPWRHHHSEPDAHAQSSSRRDITDEPDDTDDPPEMIYRYNGQHISPNNEVGHIHREKKFIYHSFEQWARNIYGQRYTFLGGAALRIAYRRYNKRRLHGPYAQHTPLRQQIREEVMRPIDEFGAPRKRHKKYTRAMLHAL